MEKSELEQVLFRTGQTRCVDWIVSVLTPLQTSDVSSVTQRKKFPDSDKSMAGYLWVATTPVRNLNDPVDLNYVIGKTGLARDLYEEYIDKFVKDATVEFMQSVNRITGQLFEGQVRP